MRAFPDTSESPVAADPAADGDVRQAAICVIAAMAIIGVADNYAALVAREGAGLWQFHALRSAIAVPILLAAGAVGVGRLAPRRAGRVLLRSILSASSMLLYFGAIGLFPIAVAIAGLFSAPIWVVLIQALVWRERIGWRRILAVALGFAGILMVVQPDPAAPGLALVLPLGAGLLYALTGLYTRRRCGAEDTLSLLAGNFLMLGAAGLAGLVAFHGQDGGYLANGWVAMTPALWASIALQAAGALIGVYLLIRAYQLSAPAIVGTLEYALMIFGPAYAWAVFGEALGPIAILGLCVITASAVLIIWRGRVRG